MYQVQYSKQAIKALRKLPRPLSKQIVNAINKLAVSPHSVNQVKILKGIEGYRLRVRNWRIIYTLKKDGLTICVIKIAPRGEVYK